MNKEREIDGIKVFVSNETYNEYKGTLQEQIDELQNRIDKAIEYIKELCYIESKKEWFNYGDDLTPKYIVDILQGKEQE